MSSHSPDKEISLLEVLKTHPDAGQRDMAEAIGLSLGMTNLLLKELSAKGWILVHKITPKNFQYLLTPDGLTELSKRSYRYLKKTIRHVADCRVQLENLIDQVKRKGFDGLQLVGDSQVDFVLEFLCSKHNLNFEVIACAQEKNGWFIVYGENSGVSPNVLEYLEPVLGT